MRTTQLRPVPLPGGSLANQQGVVLILVLIMMLLFSILGATVLTSATSELQVTGNYRNQQQAFFTTDGALEQSQLSNAIYGVMTTPEDIWTGVISYTAAGVVTVTPNTLVAAGSTNAAQVVAEFIDSGPAPKGSGFDETYQANYFSLDVTGYGPNNTELEINASIARMQVKP